MTVVTTNADQRGHELYGAATAAAEEGGDPYPFLRELVAGSPMHVAPNGDSLIYGYHLAHTMLVSRSLFKGGQHVSSIPPGLTDEQRALLEREAPDDPAMLSAIDDPDHVRLRRLVSIAFTPKAVEQYRDAVGRALDQSLASLDPTQPADLLTTICSDVPTHVIGELIGLPMPDRAWFASKSRLQAAGRDPGNSFDVHLDAVRARREMFDLLAELIDTERARPTDTPLGRLVKLEQQGEKISTAELVSLVGLMYMAGFGTTMRTLGNAVVAFIRNPDQAAALRADPSRTRAATEEILRYDPPVMTVGYFVGDGAVAGDRPLAPGTQCTVVLGASNQDPTVFDRPAAFDITAARTDPPLSFGYGTHFCLGSNLTKLEVDVVVSELVRRFPRMELAEKPQRKPSFRSREFVRVPVVLEPGG